MSIVNSQLSIVFMRKLLDFLISKCHWFLFVLLEIISFVLIYYNHAYQRNIMFGSADVVMGHVAAVSSNVMAYLHLREVNRELLERNGQLEMELLDLQDRLEMMRADTVLFSGSVSDSTRHFPYSFIVADVVSNSVTRLSNYITLNKGRADGVEPDMGVVSNRGVVGIISTVSEHFSVVIPLLNPKSRLSCKILGSSYFGSLSWNGHDARFANLEELPRHVKFEKGDTIVTSGYSAVFPAGMIVGRVVDYKKQRDDNFYSLEIELATDFRVLDHVRIIRNYRQAEQKKIEQEARKND